jgi:hypothetical protein
MNAVRLLVLAPLLAMAACGASTGASDEPSTGVTGVVWLAPICPVEQEGEPCDAERAGQVKVTLSEPATGDEATGRTVGTATSDDRGRFTIAVEPGSYLLTADAGMFCKPMPVEVLAGDPVSVDLSCDTGIR